jgi:hypothetical protein
MNIIVKCNLDRYPSYVFPRTMPYPPRVGDYVEVCNQYKNKYEAPYPVQLEVKQVVHTELFIEIHVWYDKTRLEHLHAMNLPI